MTARMLDELGLLTADGRAAQVRFERPLAAPPAEVWSSLTEPSRVARWLGRLSGDLRVGGAYTLDMADPGAADPAADRATGEVLACDAPHRLLVTWRFPGEDPSEIEARVEARGPGSVLVLEHRRLTRGAARGYGAGWHTFLDHLELLHAGREDEWRDRFAELLPTYRGLLPAVGPVRVEVTDGLLTSTDPAATAQFLADWLGWGADDATGSGASTGRDEGEGAGGAGADAAPGARVLHGVPDHHPGLALVARAPRGGAHPDAMLTWSDVETLRESLVSAVGSGARLPAGRPGDVEADGAELECPGQIVLRVRAEADGSPGA